MAFDWISLTTDYGTHDGYAAVCRGVIARIAPQARVIDVTHNVPPQDVARGARVLAQTVPYLPPAVHLAVVDPTVGTARRGLAIVARDGVLVGPDNGLLMPAADALGGVVSVVELSEPTYWLPVVSATFHGRDVFAPVAAHLAAGLPADRLGRVLDTGTLVRLHTSDTTIGAGRMEAEVMSVDRFGNVQLAATADDLEAVGLEHDSRVRLRMDTVTVEATLGSTFADVPSGALLAYVDSSGLVALAVNGGSAASRLGISPGVRLGLESTN
ncbi:MAG: SAM-dependent chlorinase/fluorinase [Actinobacteria bacterium]|nr:SAM-dependent chlorinase/fluorinase [Actinomycetota bacterium]MBI3688508.1 SAM-dependent chlorinase/fluorinase [Actinomycetota bacterium]